MGRFYDRLQFHWDAGRFVCVGLDPNIDAITKTGYESHYSAEERIYRYLRQIVDATSNIVCAYKPNWAFFFHESTSAADPPRTVRLRALQRIIHHIRENYPDVVLILDAKVGDIGNTNEGYVRFAFDILDCDAITVHPTMGMEAMKPFLDRADRGVIVLARTSNPGAGEFQNLPIPLTLAEADAWGFPIERLTGPTIAARQPVTMPLYAYVACRVAYDWNYNDNCALVVGATAPEELAEVRRLAYYLPILIPGVGAQGGDLTKAVRNGRRHNNQGIVINASRSVLYPKNAEGQTITSPPRDIWAAAVGEVQRMNREIHTALSS